QYLQQARGVVAVGMMTMGGDVGASVGCGRAVAVGGPFVWVGAGALVRVGEGRRVTVGGRRVSVAINMMGVAVNVGVKVGVNVAVVVAGCGVLLGAVVCVGI